MAVKPPPGFRFDPFADARMGRSLFQMQSEDWLVPDDQPKTEKPMTTITEEKLNSLRAAMHDLADEYDEKLQPEYAETLREVSNNRDMMVKFAGLLAHYDTPKAAVEAMHREGEARRPAITAGADLSGGNVRPGSVMQQPLASVDLGNGTVLDHLSGQGRGGGMISTESAHHGTRGRSSFAKSFAGEGDNRLD